MDWANPKELKLNIYGSGDEADYVRKHREFVNSVTSEATKECDTFILCPNLIEGI